MYDKRRRGHGAVEVKLPAQRGRAKGIVENVARGVADDVVIELADLRVGPVDVECSGRALDLIERR